MMDEREFFVGLREEFEEHKQYLEDIERTDKKYIRSVNTSEFFWFFLKGFNLYKLVINIFIIRLIFDGFYSFLPIFIMSYNEWKIIMLGYAVLITIFPKFHILHIIWKSIYSILFVNPIKKNIPLYTEKYIETISNTKCLKRIPPEYIKVDYIQYIINCYFDDRCDTLREALNMLDAKLENRTIINLQREVEYTNEKVDSLESKVENINNSSILLGDDGKTYYKI